jgi:hypothetical protein
LDGWASATGIFHRRQTTLLGISKRGNRYVRRLLSSGARSVIDVHSRLQRIEPSAEPV